MSIYTQFSNKNPDGSDVTFTQALSDVFLHPLDSLRAFVAAPFVVAAGTVSGVDSLPSVQQTVADVVTSYTGTSTPVPNQQTAPAQTLPTWIKFTIGAAAVAVSVVIVKGALK